MAAREGSVAGVRGHRRGVGVGWALAVWLALPPAQAQDVLLQAWYWDYPKPGCGGYEGPSWAARMASKAAEQAEAGFTMVWLPPLSRGSFGACSNGYDPQDLYDYGQASGRTGLGTGDEVEGWLAALDAAGLIAVADVIYNHRDGGAWEDNPVVRDYVVNYPFGGGCSGAPATPYPVNGKFRYALALGGSSGNGAGDYYFKFSSASANPAFNGRQYQLYFRTSLTEHDPTPIFESPNNGGGDCGQPADTIALGRDIFATQEVGAGCNTDEFHLPLSAADFDPSGDLLEVYIAEVGGGGAGIDQRLYGLWSTSAGQDIVAQVRGQTRTDFSQMQSGLGAMHFRHFKPNGITPTCLVGELDYPYFFFDVEQAYDGSQGGASTLAVYADFNRWLWDGLGLRGLRIDAVKHFPASFVAALLNDLHASGRVPPLVVGEHFTVDRFVLRDWVDAVYQHMTPAAANAIQVRAFDFDLRDALKRAADDGLYDVRNIYQRGMVDGAGMHGLNVVTFVNNHDYRTVGEHLLARQLLAYVYLLTNNRIGLPSVFWPDYAGVPIYGPEHPLPAQRVHLDALMALHRLYIAGAPEVVYLNRFGTPFAAQYRQSGPFDHLLYQIRGGVGGRDLLVVINFENQPLRLRHEIVADTAPVGSTFTRVAGYSASASALVESGVAGLGPSVDLDLPAYGWAVYVHGQPLPGTPAADWIFVSQFD